MLLELSERVENFSLSLKQAYLWPYISLENFHVSFTETCIVNFHRIFLNFPKNYSKFSMKYFKNIYRNFVSFLRSNFYYMLYLIIKVTSLFVLMVLFFATA